MPTTRRSSGATGRSSTGPSKQSTLTFSHRVTKSVPKSAKESVISSSLTKPGKAKAKDIKAEDEVVEQIKTEEDVEEEVEEEEQKSEQEQEDVLVPEKSDVELKAEKVTDAAIQRYWRKLEAQRMAKRVHQENLTTGEKVLRYFDVSSHYGPCIGITRIRRWQRAQRLGLNPPIEVLAVLLKEEAKDNKTIQRAHIDEIMNATAVGA